LKKNVRQGGYKRKGTIVGEDLFLVIWKTYWKRRIREGSSLEKGKQLKWGVIKKKKKLEEVNFNSTTDRLEGMKFLKEKGKSKIKGERVLGGRGKKGVP